MKKTKWDLIREYRWFYKEKKIKWALVTFSETYEQIVVRIIYDKNKHYNNFTFPKMYNFLNFYYRYMWNNKFEELINF